MTHRAEPTTPNRGQSQGETRHSKFTGKRSYFRADFLFYPVHCTLIWQLLPFVGVAAAPQKPVYSSSPAAWDIRQKGSAGKVLAHGHIPSTLSTCQEQDGGAGELREAGMWLRAHWKYRANHNTASSPVLWDSGTTSSLILQSSQQLSPLYKLQGLCGSAPHHRGFCRLITCKVQLIGQSR